MSYALLYIIVLGLVIGVFAVIRLMAGAHEVARVLEAEETTPAGDRL